MATIDYPTGLPCPQVGTIEDDGIDPWVQDGAEVGVARRRKRFTRTLGRWGFTLLMTKEEVAVLRTFYDATLDSGVHEFNWQHPLTFVTYEVRFAGRPKIGHMYAKRYKADVVLEEI